MKKYIISLLLTIVFTGLAMAVTQNVQNEDSIQEVRLLRLAAKYRHGVSRDPNPQKAASIYKHLARTGNAKAMDELGRMYLTGDGVTQNYKCAYRLFKAASEKGNNKAKCDLALLYQKGLGCDINMAKAYNLYLEASKDDYPQGHYGVGNLLYKGLGVKQDYKAAIEYLKKGSDHHHPGCSFLLASYYANGFDANSNTDLATKYLNRASNDGHGWTVDITKNEVFNAIKERKGKRNSWKRVKDGTIKSTEMPSSEANVASDFISGSWSGYTYTYDWSRKNILNENQIDIHIEAIANGIHIELLQNDSLITANDLEEIDNCYKNTKRIEDWSQDYPWLITEAKFTTNKSRLIVDINSWNTSTREYRKPILAVLDYQEDVSFDNNSSFSIAGIKANGNNKIMVKINASYEMNIHAYLNSIDGTNAIDLGEFNLHTGDNTIELKDHHSKNMRAIVIDNNKGERHSRNITVNPYE